jgi:hypothetical protein
MSPLRTILMAMCAFALSGGAASAQAEQKLGVVSFDNSCAASAQPELQRAVALLHSFWWKEADDAFAEVLAHDPGCAIATWGMATVAIGNPFGTGATPAAAEKALAAIGQGRKIGAKTERERSYIEAIAAYYDRFDQQKPAQRLRALADAFAEISG